MGDIEKILTESEARVWKQQVKQDGHCFKERLAYGKKYKAWIGLGFKSWSECVRSIADEFQLSERHIWRLSSDIEKPRLKPKNAETTDINVSENIDSSPKTQVSSESGDSEAETEDLPPVLVYFDKEKRQVPERLAAFFQEVDDQLRPVEFLIRQLEKAFNDLFDEDDPVWKNLNINQIKKIHISNLKREIKFKRPWAWCPICHADGGIDGNCMTCHGDGWLRLTEWNAIPDSDK